MLRLVFPILFVLIWSTGFIVARGALPHADLQVFLLIRLSAVAALLAVMAALVRARWPDLRQAGYHMLAGALLQGVYLCFSYWAIAHGLPAGIMALLGALQPLFTAGFVALRGESLTTRAWAGLLIGFAGVSCVLAPKLATVAGGSLSWPASLAAFLSVAGVTAGSLVQKRLRTSDLRVSAALQTLGGAAVAAVMVVMGGHWNWDGSVPLWGALAWSVVVASLIGVTLLMWMLRHGEATKVTALILLVPPLAALQAFVLFHEVLAPIQLVGFALALVGVMLTRWSNGTPRFASGAAAKVTASS